MRKWIYAAGTAALILVSYNIGRMAHNQQTYSVNVNDSKQDKSAPASHGANTEPKKFYKTGLPNFKSQTYKGITYPTIELQKEYAHLNNPDLSGKDIAKIIYEKEH